MVEIDPDDLQLNATHENGKLRVRLRITDSKVYDILKHIYFKDPHKEFRRQICLEQMEANNGD